MPDIVVSYEHSAQISNVHLAGVEVNPIAGLESRASRGGHCMTCLVLRAFVPAGWPASLGAGLQALVLPSHASGSGFQSGQTGESYDW